MKGQQAGCSGLKQVLFRVFS